MNFFFFSAISGVVLIIAPVYLALRFRKEWKMPKGLFLRAGVTFLVLEIFHFAAMDSALSYWPDFMGYHFMVQAVILGIIAGLFFELGRFFVLDKLFRKVRKMKEGLYFALGWNGVVTFLVGFLFLLGSIGMYIMATTPDIMTLFPPESGVDAEMAQLYQDQSIELMGSFPLYGLVFLLERAALLILDLFMTLLILVGLTYGQNRFAWFAALGHAGFFMLVFAAQRFDTLIYIPILIGISLLLFWGLQKLKPLFLEKKT